jgi:hypothetical protein
MLVWLASYPRSGNTLLRQVLKTCFDLTSCEGLEPVPADFRTRKPDGSCDEFSGSYFVEGDPETFYDRARTDPELVLIKTHQLPRDAEKAIYVVRDGRLALQSFTAYQDAYHPGTSSFEALLVGDHPYGEWTTHYRAWCERPEGALLVLRFEELRNAGPALLERIRAFLGVSGPARPWVNPQAQLRARDPVFFGPGLSAWAPEPFWTPVRLKQFYTLHGPLLARLGYALEPEVEGGAYPADSDEAHLLQFVRTLAEHRTALHHESVAREAVLARVRRLCDESMCSVNTLAETCQLRDRLLAELTQKSERRTQVLNRQLVAANVRIAELERHCRHLERRMWWRRLPLFGALRHLVLSFGGRRLVSGAVE